MKGRSVTYENPLTEVETWSFMLEDSIWGPTPTVGSEVFSLALVGTILFNDKSRRVYLPYMPTSTKDYNWGPTLATSYCNMDAVYGGKNGSINSYWSSWEVS
ncbi:unnamed protein product [Prunus armeniaca]